MEVNSGLILQWSKVSVAANATSTITFPIGFTTCFDVIGCGGWTGYGQDVTHNLVNGSITATTFKIGTRYCSMYYYISIGT